MSQDINDPLAKVCGNCEHGVFADTANVACFGAPPVPVVLGATKNLAGQMQPHIQALRPILSRGERACGMFRERATQLIGLAKSN